MQKDLFQYDYIVLSRTLKHKNRGYKYANTHTSIVLRLLPIVILLLFKRLCVFKGKNESERGE